MHVPVGKRRGDYDAVVLVRDAVEPRRVDAGGGEGRIQEVGKGWITGSRFTVGEDC